MWNRDDPRLAGMYELVVRALDALEPPAVSLQLLDDLRAPHGGYYTHSRRGDRARGETGAAGERDSGPGSRSGPSAKSPHPTQQDQEVAGSVLPRREQGEPGGALLPKHQAPFHSFTSGLRRADFRARPKITSVAGLRIGRWGNLPP